MCDQPVAKVMTRQVFSAGLDTPFYEVVTMLVLRDLAALPVLDATGRPAGIVTAQDAACKLEFHGRADLPPLVSVRGWPRWRKAGALTAGDMMTTPAPVVRADLPVHAALRELADRRATQLCVIDPGGLLVGVFTHHNALHAFLRGDAALRADIEDHVPDGVTVHVADGIVTLDGALHLRSAADHAARTAKHTLGVIAVHNNLSYTVDDLTFHGL